VDQAAFFVEPARLSSVRAGMPRVRHHHAKTDTVSLGYQTPERPLTPYSAPIAPEERSRSRTPGKRKWLCY